MKPTQARRRGIAFTMLDRLILVAYGVANPTDQEWIAYLEFVERHGIDRTVQLIVTDGGGPTTKQSRQLNELLNGRSVPIAVVSGSARVRGVVTALSFFNSEIRAFSPSRLRDAIAYLQSPASRTDLIIGELEKLRRALEEAP